MTNSSKRRSASAGKRRAKPAGGEPAATGPAGVASGPAGPAGGEPAAAGPAKVEAGLGGVEAADAGAVEAALAGVEPAPADAASGRMLRWAVRVLQIEAAATGLLTLVWIWAAVAAASVSTSSAIATPAFFALCCAILAGLAVALGRGKALARAPAIVLEMLMIPMGYYMIVGGLAWLGVPTIVLGLAGSVFLLAPSTRTALGLR